MKVHVMMTFLLLRTAQFRINMITWSKDLSIDFLILYKANSAQWANMRLALQFSVQTELRSPISSGFPECSGDFVKRRILKSL